MKIISFLLLFIFAGISTLKAETLTYEDIISVPDVTNVTISPNGRYLAYLLKVDTKTNKGILVAMLDTKDLSEKQLVYSENEKYVITSILWANNDILLVRAKFPASRYGVPTTETRLLKVDIATAKVQSVLHRSLFKRMKYIPNVLSTIVDILPDDDDHILMSLAGFSDFVGESVVKVALTDKGRTYVVQSAQEYISDWLTDTEHNVRIGIYRKETEYKIFEKQSSGDLIELWKFQAFGADKVWPLGFGANNNILYVEALYQGKDAIYKVDLTDPKLTKELVFHHENYDVSGSLRRSKKTNDFVGIGYHYWDEAYKNFIAAIDKALPDTDNLLLDFSDDGNSYVVLGSNDNIPGTYFIGNRKEKKLDVFAYKYEKLLPELLASKKRISYQARDGLTIEGYLTLPIGKQDKNLPTIVFPHGGPISYNGSGFDYWTQFFAHKGYAVLQMNFRGSSGYGYDFMKQGLASWGQAMQDDVEDGTRWLIKEGISNKEKICIIGASYGGYAALMGAVKTPELYQCVVSFAGVTDVEELVKSHRAYTNYDIVKKQVGDDFDQLWDISPLKHAKKINMPVLLIHGTKDRVVRVEHSEEMFDELEDNDKVVQFIELEMGDHFLSNNEHRLQTFGAMDAFLDKYLPVK